MPAHGVMLPSVLSLHRICVIQVLDDLAALKHRCARVGILDVRHLQSTTVHEEYCIRRSRLQKHSTQQLPSTPRIPSGQLQHCQTSIA